MISRWYRSRLFWLGLAGLVMLLVAWARCTRITYTLGVGGSMGFYFVRNDSTFIMFGHTTHADSRIGGYTLPMGINWNDVPSPKGSRIIYFTPAFQREIEPGGSVHTYVAILVFVPVYCAMWLGGMVWWRRRKHRLLNTSLSRRRERDSFITGA